MPPEIAIPDALLDALRDAQHVCVLTGAGVSAESGVPTFREAQSGLWEKYDPLQLATPDAFQRDPTLVWRWYRWRRKLVAEAEPNAGHIALAKLQTLVPEMTLITQNVDGLHQRAGSDRVIEFHGNLFVNRCSAPCSELQNVPDTDDPPACTTCGALVRPGVVWFGEAIPEEAMGAAMPAVATSDVFLSVGTSAAVWPAAGFAEMAAQNGAVVVEINPEHTDISDNCHFRIPGQSGVVLPELIDCLRSTM